MDLEAHLEGGRDTSIRGEIEFSGPVGVEGVGLSDERGKRV